MYKFLQYIKSIISRILVFVDLVFDTSGYCMWKQNDDEKWIYFNDEIE